MQEKQLLWRNWIAHKTSNLGVAGSNPARSALLNKVICGRVAQSVEQWSNKPPVAGSIPVMTMFVFCSF